VDATGRCAGEACAAATTTVRPDTEATAEFLGGFIAAEGCFSTSGERRFVFQVGLGSVDEAMCLGMQSFLGAGRIYRSARRRPHYDDEVHYSVQSTEELVELVVPFMDAHLPESHKRDQYLEWRARLLDHWEHRARRAASAPRRAP